MLNFLNEANWWCLLLLLLLAFLLGWFLSERSNKKKFQSKLDECNKEKELLINKDFSKANSTFTNTDTNIKADTPESGVDIIAPKLDFDSFGKADPTAKDDLKLISGIGPFIEEKLNSIGIYTYEQISKFNSKDIDTVTHLIEFFPGRIERDKWTKQAKKLLNKK